MMSIDLNRDVLIQRRFQKTSSYFVAAAAIIAVLVLAGWQVDVMLLQKPLPRSVAMNPATALCLLLACLSLRLVDMDRSVYRRMGIISAVIVLIIALLRLSNIAHFFPFAIDLVLYRSKLAVLPGGYIRDRMSVSSALCLLLLAISLLLMRVKTIQGQFLCQLAALAAALPALFSIMGYLYRVREFYGIFRHIPMAIHGGVSVLLLAFGILCARPDKGIMKDFTTRMSGSILAKLLIPVAVLVPLVLGLLRLFGYWAGIFSTEFGVTILVLSIILVFLITIRYVTILLNRRDLESSRMAGELLASENRFHILVNSIADYAIFQIDASGNIESWNTGAQKIKGYTAEEVIGRSISIFYTHEDIEKGIPEQNLAMARTHGRHSSEGWRVRKDGTKFWGDIVFTALYDGGGQLKGYAKITRDRTALRQVQEQNAYLARLMEDTSDAIMSVDMNYRVVSWNKAAEELYGYTAQEATGKDVSAVIRTTSSPELQQAIRRQIREQGHWKGEIRHYDKNNSILHLLISASTTRDTDGRIDGIVFVCRDITERKKHEEQLQQFNEHLEDLVRKKTEELLVVFERMSDGIMGYDRDGSITYVNKQAAVMNRRPPEDLIGKNFWELFPSAAKNEFAEYFAKALAAQQNQHFEMFSPSLQLWIECFMYPSEDGLSLFFRDITEKRRAQETIMRHSEELRQLASHLQDIREDERAAMAREIHDELGQQLTGIKMDVSWLSRNLGKQPQETLTDKMKGTLGLLDITIKTVRRIATELRPSILDDLGLIAAIEWLCQEFQRRSGILASFQSAHTEFPFEPSTAIGLFRICQESLTNVARHSGAKHVWVSLEWGQGQLTLRIKDDGQGLPKNGVKGKKTLGLLGMKERALMMGGSLDIRSEEEGGLTLEVSIPLKEPTA